MAFWSALIYTPPFLSLSSVKRCGRRGAASSHSCELHLPGVRGSIVNSDLVPSTMLNYYPYHVIYTSSFTDGQENCISDVKTGQLCSCRTHFRHEEQIGCKQGRYQTNCDLHVQRNTDLHIAYLLHIFWYLPSENVNFQSFNSTATDTLVTKCFFSGAVLSAMRNALQR